MVLMTQNINILVGIGHLAWSSALPQFRTSFATIPWRIPTAISVSIQKPFSGAVPISTVKRLKMSTASAPTATTGDDNTLGILSLPYNQFREHVLEPKIKWKERSENTHNEVHKPGLEAVAPLTPYDTDGKRFCFDVVYIGDSMFERFKTTGTATQLYNSPGLSSFNLGVGGDKIENVLYRLHLGICVLMHTRPPKLWVVQIGTNNLTVKRGLRPDVEIKNYKLLIQTLMRLSPQGKVLCTGLYGRKDVPDEVVLQSNEEIKMLVNDMKGELNREILFYLEPASAMTKDHLVDHVHLTEEGYGIWDEHLFPQVQSLVAREDEKK